jgi:hypothetical protein
MSSVLHITNGDAFTSRFKNLNISGEVVTWREMLCEGKTTVDVGSESFWRHRFNFLNQTYKVSKKIFIEGTLKEYRNLCNHKKQDRIVLWFEYDLFCQINMIAVISWLKKHRPGAEISLVCSGNEDDTDKEYGLCELNDIQLHNLYTNKTVLNSDDIDFAEYVWQLYCSDNPIRLETLVKFDKSQFKYLSKAIKAHLKRYPSLRNGLNVVEQLTLDTAFNFQPENERQLVGQILKDQRTFGYGDSQYFQIIDHLKPLFASLDPVKLSKLGIKALENSLNVYSTLQDESYLGGTRKYNYIYNHHQDKLLKL